MASVQGVRAIVRWVIFFIALIGLPVVWLRYFMLGTICWYDPLFNLQNLLIHLVNPFGWGYLRSGGGTVLLLIAVTLGGLLILTLIFGRVFCSWICPFGTLLDFFGKLAPVLGFRERHIPESLQERTIKYGVLVGFLIAAGALARPVFCDICPAGAFYRATGPFIYAFPWLLMFPVIIFIAIVILALLYDHRAWCKYICPLGALVALTDRLSWWRVKLPTHACIECRNCEDACPMDVHIVNSTRYGLINDPKVKQILEAEGDPELLSKPMKFDKLPERVQEVLLERADLYTVPPGECIRCYQCVDACPIVKRERAEKKAAKVSA